MKSNREFDALDWEFIRQLCLSDHMGDAADAVTAWMEVKGYFVEWHEWSELYEHIESLGLEKTESLWTLARKARVVKA